MTLKSFGCSFIFGTDLSDEQSVPGLCVNPSQKTWPAVLANKLGCEYHCYARPGAGNLQILENMMNCVAESDHNDFFIIGWSWIDRFDYYNTEHQDILWNNWNTARPTGTDLISKNYYQNLHSEYQDKLTNLIYIKTAIDLLHQKRIKFLMTYMDELMFDQRWHVTPAVKVFQEYVRPYMTTFEGQTFLNWSRKHKFAESNNWHPLEQAHDAAADYMLKVFDMQNTNDLIQQAHV